MSSPPPDLAQRLLVEQIERQNLEIELLGREAERAARAKAEFLATASHELRTPLHAILGFSQLLASQAMGSLNAKQESYVGFVRQSAEHLLVLVDDILDLSRLEAGELRLECGAVPLKAAVAEALAVIRPLAAQKSQRLATRLAGGSVVWADRSRVKQILINLLANAVRYMEPGGEIGIETQPVGRRLCVTVRDHGIGIAPDQQESVFDPFYRIRSGREGSREGTGLGLAVVRRLVEAQGGRVWIESDLGRGSAVSFLLPSSEEGARTMPPVARGRPLIAVVAPEDCGCDVQFLRSERLRLIELKVSDGPWPAQIEELRPDLVLACCGSESARAELLARLGGEHGEARPPVIVAAPATEKRGAFLAGAAAFVVRSTRPEELLATVRRLLPTSNARRPVLVVDHRRDRSERLALELLRAGHRPLTTSSGEAALAMLGPSRAFAVVLALDLPRLDAFQTLVRLRGDPRFAALPILALADSEAALADARRLDARLHLGLVQPDEVSAWILATLAEIEAAATTPAAGAA